MTPAGRLALILGTGFEDVLAQVGARPVPGAAVNLHRASSGALLLLRHGPGHSVPPHRLDHHAHVRALSDAGVTHVIAFASVGSLVPAVRLGDVVTPDDLLDPSFAPPTFFDDRVVHTAMTTPFDPALAAHARARFAAVGGGTCHAGGVYVQVRGPRYPTRAECAFLATHGTVVGMTVASEATLAAERALRYAAVCLVTDGHDDLAPNHDAITAAAPATRARLGGLIADLLQ